VQVGDTRRRDGLDESQANVFGERLEEGSAAAASRRSTWKAAKLWAVGMSSTVLTFTCGGCPATQVTTSAMSSARSGCMPS
jgi:hypothetical protein